MSKIYKIEKHRRLLVIYGQLVYYLTPMRNCPLIVIKLLAMNRFLCLLTLITVTIASCKKEKVSNYDNFSTYISDYSTSPISRCQDISIKLGFKPPENTIVPSNIITTTPDMGGVVEYKNGRIYLRNPVIKHNIKYQVKFYIGAITEMPSGMDYFEFPLEAERQAWDIQMEAPINNSMEYVTYSGTIKYALCEPHRKIIEESMVATQEGKPLNISWDHPKNEKDKSYFQVYKIERQDKAGEIKLLLDMNTINVKDQSTLTLPIPSKSDFSLHSAKHNNNNVVELVFTDPLDKSQNLTGLITVTDRKIDQIKVISNKIVVYFSDNKYGKHTVNIEPGIKNIAGYKLKDSYEKPIFFAPPKPTISIAESGHILPPTGEWELPVNLISASGFRLRVLKVYDNNVHRLYQENKEPYVNQQGLENIGRLELDTIFTIDVVNAYDNTYHAISLDKYIRKEKGALYKIFLSIPREHNLYPCEELQASNKSKDRIETINFDKPWIGEYDNDYDEYNGYYRSRTVGRRQYTEQPSGYHGNPCHENYSLTIHDSRLLMCSDIAAVIKSNTDNGNYLAYVSKITTATPIASAKVTLLNVQGQEIGTAYTDGQGFAKVPTQNQIPFLARVNHNDNFTYIQLQDGMALSLSTFQVEGKNWKGDRKVFFYGDRGVWRPGDTVYMQSIVFDDKKIPSNLPIELKLTDPTGKLVKKWLVRNNSYGLYDCRFHTDMNANTGPWKLEMQLGGVTYRKTVKIETVRPNRLKMNMAFAKEELLSNTDSHKAPLSVDWMHGLPAKDLETQITMFQKSLRNPFGADYSNYVFDDIQKSHQEDLGMVKSGKTNSKGKLDFKIPVAENKSYPSMMLYNFELRSFEKGGAFSNDMKRIKYSPYDSYIGMSFPGGTSDRGAYLSEKDAIQLVAIDENGNKKSSKVKVTINEIQNQWWYQFGNRGNYAALKNNIKRSVKTYETTIGKEGKTISIEDTGRFLITIQDIESGHTVSRIFYCYNSRYNNKEEELSNLEVLQFHIEKTDYNVGDLLEFKLPPAKSGQYLVTVESGNGVLHKEVRPVSTTPQDVFISIIAEMSPSAYVHVHLMQAWDKHNNDRPLRLFGIKPIKVFDQNSILEPVISMPDELETDKPFQLSVAETNGQSMSYTIAIVDQGLLDITQFSTPDPWTAFFGKESLNVKTWDMYRDIFHRFLGEYASLLAIGGDGMNTITNISKAQRFKPVVKFLGPFKLDPGEKRSHNLTINDYVGSVRAMVVATNGNALGHQDKTVAVKKPLMLYSTLPRVLGPQEKLKVPVTVFAMRDDVKTVDVSIVTDNNITVIGEKSKQISFDKIGEQDQFFEIETGDFTGITEVEVIVKSGTHIHREKTQLDIRPSAPKITQIFHDLVTANNQKILDYKPLGMTGTRSAQLHLSKGLNFSFRPQIDWLIRYPHGCLEQTISTIFPQLFVAKMNIVKGDDLMRTRQQYQAAIQKLRFLQIHSGGFSYWPGGNIANKWGTSYALEFLQEAKNNGYEVPADLLKKCIKHQYAVADSWTLTSTNSSRHNGFYTIDQAYRLHTLANAGKPNYAAMNRLRLSPSLHNTAKWLLAHAFLTVGEEAVADKLIQAASDRTESYRQMSGNFGSEVRDQALIVRTLIKKGDKLKAKRLIDELTPHFSGDKQRYLSTQDRSQCLISFAKFMGKLDSTESDLTYDITLPGNKPLTGQTLTTKNQSFNLSTEDKAQSVALTNNGPTEIYSCIEVTGVPLRDDSPASSQDIKLEVKYIGEDGSIIKPSQIQKGTDFTIQYTIQHDGLRSNYENLALSAIFPSGWEIINQRMVTNTNFNAGDKPDYQDIRDDRVYLYFDLEKGKKKVFRFKMNATYEGKYWAPPAFCEAMYDATINAKQKGFWAEVN